MQIAFHIGANCTDDDRLLKSALRNASDLLHHGIAVPGPGKYRSLIRESLAALDLGPPAPDTRDVLIDAIVEDDDIGRLLLSNDNFIAIPKRIFDHALLYHQAETKVAGLKKLFPGDEISLFLGLRNPAAFLQDTATRAGVSDLQSYLGLMQPEDFRWSDLVRRIRRAAPDVPLYVWCNEDTPLIWADLLGLFCGAPAGTPLTGAYDLAKRLVDDAGQKAFDTAPIKATRAERHEFIAGIIEGHALPETLTEILTLPDLTDELVEHLTDQYDHDVELIASLDGVTVVLPFQ